MSPGNLRTIPVDQICHRPDARRRTDDALAALADSIEKVGLINPIRVRASGVGFEVVAGSHRLQAVDSLGWHEVPCLVVADDDLHAELAMIDENLCRAELSPAERGAQTARRKAIYLELHPQTAHGGDRSSEHQGSSRQLGDLKSVNENNPIDRFTAETAAATGRSERAVQRDAERGEKVIPEALDIVRGTKIDTGAYLDKLKRLPPNEQVTAAKRDLAWREKQDREKAEGEKRGGIAGRYVPKVAPPEPPTKVFDRFISLVDEIEVLPVADLVAAAGKRRSVLNQRASGLADLMDRIRSYGD